MGAYIMCTNDITKMYALNTQNVLKKIGLDTWLKYQHLFPSNNFQFVVKQEEEFLEVYIINKKEFLSTVRSNIKELCEKARQIVHSRRISGKFHQRKRLFKFVEKSKCAWHIARTEKRMLNYLKDYVHLKKWNPYFGYSLRKPNSSLLPVLPLSMKSLNLSKKTSPLFLIIK